MPGFYGFETNYTILNSASLEGTTFGSLEASNSHLIHSLSYTPTGVILTVQNAHPFQDFSFTISNAKIVGNNLELLHSQGELTPDLFNIVNSFNGKALIKLKKFWMLCNRQVMAE